MRLMHYIIQKNIPINFFGNFYFSPILQPSSFIIRILMIFSGTWRFPLFDFAYIRWLYSYVNEWKCIGLFEIEGLTHAHKCSGNRYLRQTWLLQPGKYMPYISHILTWLVCTEFWYNKIETKQLLCMLLRVMCLYFEIKSVIASVMWQVTTSIFENCGIYAISKKEPNKLSNDNRLLNLNDYFWRFFLSLYCCFTVIFQYISSVSLPFPLFCSMSLYILCYYVMIVWYDLCKK